MVPNGAWQLHWFIMRITCNTSTEIWVLIQCSFCITSKGNLSVEIRQLNTLRLRENGCSFQDDIFKCIFLNENVWNSIKISLKFVPKGPINNIPALVQIMAWCRPGDKPLSEPMMVTLSTHIWVTRPQWVKDLPPQWEMGIPILVRHICIESPLHAIGQGQWPHWMNLKMHIWCQSGDYSSKLAQRL